MRGLNRSLCVNNHYLKIFGPLKETVLGKWQFHITFCTCWLHIRSIFGVHYWWWRYVNFIATLIYRYTNIFIHLYCLVIEHIMVLNYSISTCNFIYTYFLIYIYVCWVVSNLIHVSTNFQLGSCFLDTQNSLFFSTFCRGTND